MADSTDNSFLKRPYESPSFTRRLVSDVRSLLRKASQPENPPQAVGLSAPMCPVLLVEDFQGEVDVIGRPAHIPSRHDRHDSSLRRPHWVEMHFEPDPEAVSHEPFLLLDLRDERSRTRSLLDAAGSDATPGSALPMVVLLASVADLNGLLTLHPGQCWQVRHPSPAGLIFAMQSFFDICGELRKKAPPSRHVPDRIENYVFAGQARKPEKHR
jgi:hypothetical protein